MWTTGRFNFVKTDGKIAILYYWVKHFEEPSEFGINNGRISKLSIKLDGKVIVHYDRGWDVRPADSMSCIALKIIMEKYN